MSGPLPDATVRYDDHEDAVLDLHLPADPVGEVVVIVHGGFWKAEYDRRYTRAMAAALAREGYTVAAPEYRRVGAGGGWPVTGDDVRRAVEQVPALLAGLGLQGGPMTVVGHSAGGHLALWLATTGLALRRVVGLAAVCDLREAIRLDLGDGATRALLDDADPDDADPMTLLSGPPGADVVLVHGRDDDEVPVALSRGFVSAHPWARLVEVDGGHFEVIEPGSVAWSATLEAVRAG